jgi:predicted  nucleic acid-binding Zn-ribbon protein
MRADRDAFELMEEELAATKAQVEQAEAAYGELDKRLDQTKSGVEDAESRYDQIRTDIGEMVRTAYMQGPAGPMAFLLDSASQEDLADRLSYLSATTESATALAAQATELVTSLRDRGDEIEQLLKDKQRVLSELDNQKEQLKQAAEQREQALAALTSTRNELLDLVVRLRRQLAGPDLEALQHLFQGEASVPYGTWAEAFLAQINAPSCRDNLVAMVAWQVNEGTSADWNPLATTYDMPGASSFNSSGVRNYVSLKQGLEATWLTLKRGWSSYGYAPIVQSLRRCGSAMKTAEAINASSWCRGCTYGRYVTGLIDRVAADYETYAKL